MSFDICDKLTGSVIQESRAWWYHLGYIQRLLYIYVQLPPSAVNNQQRITLKICSRERTHDILLRYTIIFLVLLAEEI